MPQQKNVFDWMNAHVGQPFNPPHEYGTDFDQTIGSPIGSPVSGKVVYVGAPYAGTNTSSLGYVVQVHAANGQLWHFQHLMSPSNGLTVGQNIAAGDVVGYSGGCATYKPDGSGCATLDAACSKSTSDPNCWSTGPHVEVRMAPSYNPAGGVWGQNWQNPLNTIQTLANAIKASSFGNQTAQTATPGTTPQVPPYQINPGAVGQPGGPQAAPCNDLLAAYYARAAQNSTPVVGGLGNVADGIGTYAQYTTCWLGQQIPSWGIHIGLFLVALVLVILGGFILIHPDPGAAVRKVVVGA